MALVKAKTDKILLYKECCSRRYMLRLLLRIRLIMQLKNI